MMARLKAFLGAGFLLLLLCSNAPPAYAQRGMDQININGQLVLAARSDNTARVVALLQDGAKVNSRDRNGNSPLNLAAAKGNTALVEVLMQAGADIQLANLVGVTPLMGAAYSANPEIMRKLLAAGAKIEPQDRFRKNAATYAAGMDCSECLQLLIQAGTPVNAVLENQLTLLMWAAGYGHEAAVRQLLAQGADRSLTDLRGKTALDMARDGGYPNVVSLFAQP